MAVGHQVTTLIRHGGDGWGLARSLLRMGNVPPWAGTSFSPGASFRSVLGCEHVASFF